MSGNKMLNTAHFVSWWGTTMAHVADLANTWKLWESSHRITSNQWYMRRALSNNKSQDAMNTSCGRESERFSRNFGCYKKTCYPCSNRELIYSCYSSWSSARLFSRPKVWPQSTSVSAQSWPPGLLRKMNVWNTCHGNSNDISSCKVKELWTHTSVESSVHRLTQELDDGELVGVSHLAITSALDGYQTQSGLLDPSGEVVLSPALGSLIVWVQQMLLILEHENVAGVMRMLGEGGIPSRHPIYDMSLGLDPARLAWAKEQATRLYPKG